MPWRGAAKPSGVPSSHLSPVYPFLLLSYIPRRHPGSPSWPSVRCEWPSARVRFRRSPCARPEILGSAHFGGFNPFRRRVVISIPCCSDCVGCGHLGGRCDTFRRRIPGPPPCVPESCGLHRRAPPRPRARHEMQNMQQCRSLRAAVEGVAGEPDRPQCSEVSAHPCSRRRQDTGSDAERCMRHARSASSGWWPATVRTLSCGHDFHEDCNIAKWLRDNKKACPVHSACNIQFHRTMSTNGGLEHLDSLFAANSLVYCRVYAKAFALAPRQLVK
ncbi:Os01g0114401 [Oryza sativa Japonica Group]|uniref:Os01g0114401 protein n=1 Tax=Oryza sativa subsp. japonica TaxID=39947 RepID=A0A0P0UXR1_ORYSJ|nr:Os01g0114401 [Oryza sativa Japonica Group]